MSDYEIKCKKFLENSRKCQIRHENGRETLQKSRKMLVIAAKCENVRLDRKQQKILLKNSRMV